MKRLEIISKRARQMLELVLLRKWESVYPMNFIICLRKKIYILHNVKYRKMAVCAVK